MRVRWKRVRDPIYLRVELVWDKIGLKPWRDADDLNIMADPEKVLAHFQKPAGWLGRLNVRHMNRRHSKLTDWGLSHVSIDANDTVLDAGCGGGKTIYKLAAIAGSGMIYGVDHSEESVAVARETNRDLIATGRVEIQKGSISHLSFPDQFFNLVTAVETHYYWPDLAADLREVLRVLKPRGMLIIIAEAYKGGKYDKRNQRFDELLKHANLAILSLQEHREIFLKAGYTDVQVDEDYEKGWLYALGRRPAAGC